MNDFGKDVYKSDSEMGAYIEIRNRTLKALRHISGMPNKPMDAIEDLQDSLNSSLGVFKMISARLLVVAAIKNDINSNSLGYRLVDVVVHAFKDITHESLEEGVRTVGCNFINTKYNMIGTGLKFATRSGTDKEFPVLTLSGKRLLTEDRYTIAYSDSRGNLIAYDAHGTKHIVQPREYLSNSPIDKRERCGRFKGDDSGREDV